MAKALEGSALDLLRAGKFGDVPKKLREDADQWLKVQPAWVEAVATGVFGSVQGAFLGGLMGYVSAAAAALGAPPWSAALPASPCPSLGRLQGRLELTRIALVAAADQDERGGPGGGGCRRRQHAAAHADGRPDAAGAQLCGHDRRQRGHERAHEARARQGGRAGLVSAARGGGGALPLLLPWTLDALRRRAALLPLSHPGWQPP